MNEKELITSIANEGNIVRELKARKASKEEVQEAVSQLLKLKTQYKELTGKDFAPSTNQASSGDKKKKVETPKTEKIVVTPPQPPQETPQLFLSGAAQKEALKCLLIAELCGTSGDFRFNVGSPPSDVINQIPIPSTPVMCDRKLIIFGSNAICRYLARGSQESENGSNMHLENVLDIEEFSLSKAVQNKDVKGVKANLDKLEALSIFSSLTLASYVLYPTLTEALTIVSNDKQEQPHTYAKLHSAVDTVAKSVQLMTAVGKLTNTIAGGGKGEETKKLSKTEKKAAKKIAQKQDNTGSKTAFSNADVVRPLLPEDIAWDSKGLISSLKLIFSVALKATFPQFVSSQSTLLEASLFRCANPNFGDFQCNNAMAISKELKDLSDYEGPLSPKDVAERIVCGIPSNQPFISSVTCAPNGFINIKIATDTITNTISDIVKNGVKPPSLPHRNVLVDFSSPNIAKEMHVGHLRSTIIGDCVCRIFEFLNFEVMRVNHVGDWGTQFGMLITYLLEAYPDILTNPPNITDLTTIYKQSKLRFDADEQFKETARLNVVKLQSGDEVCRKIWTLLCDISRSEFQKVYDALGVKLNECGESFYNPMIPTTIEELTQKGLVEEDKGMLVVRLPHFTIPLILRKSDGGYGYDSTDMAALKYRLHDLKRDWIVIITDAGQANHFYMCFDAARAANWLYSESETGSPQPQQLDHIGFGVVQGEDGKRFKTRSSETVRLIDLLDAAKDRMKESLEQRAKEGKSPLQGEELEAAAKVIGYGAVKYFDLKQNPSTNYIFSYDRMLDTRGDTAVYLLFAFARLVSILTKAQTDKNVDIESLYSKATSSNISVENPAERALAFELLQFGDVLQYVIKDLQPNRLCEYLKEVAVKFTDFVTKCHVLSPPEGESMMQSRLLLCAATRRVMEKCFSLLGIGTLERI